MKTRVAYQGRPGAFSELAARHFVTAATPVPCRWFDDVMDKVLQGTAELGVLPIHNSLAGIIAKSCALLAHAPIGVQDEIVLPIAHALLAAPGTELHHVRRVFSHPAALAQCRQFSLRHALETVATNDTAGAVEMLMNERPSQTAAIAGVHAAELYGAAILAEHIEDSVDNRTSFVLFASSARVPT